MRIHPVAGVAAILFLLLGVVVALRGELNAQALQHRRDEILADLPRRAREIESQLSVPTLDAATRERLKRQLDSCKRGQTGISAHFPYNERVSGYVIGAGLVAIGLVCLLYKPKPKMVNG
jgi:hypothetical protein